MFVPRAAAEGSITVVLLAPPVSTHVSEETLTRARAELTAAGFRVVVKIRGQEGIRSSLSGSLGEEGAIAGIAIDTSAGSSVAEVWVTDRLTGKLSLRPVETAGVRDTPSLLAIRAVELLRASLIELENPPPGKPPAAEPPAVVADFTKRETSVESARAGFSLEVLAAGWLTADPIAPAIAPGVRLAYVSPFGLGARTTWIGPSVGMNLEGALGDAVLTQAFALGEAIFVPPLDAPVNVSFSTGLGLYYVSARGDLADPSLEKSGDSAAFVATFGAGLGVPLGGPFALSLEGFVALTVPRIAIDMGSEQVGSVGRPMFGTTLGGVVGF